MKRARQSQQKLERREAILSVALDTLADTSFHAITMAQVAERASLAKGTLYLYFATKEELFLELLRDRFHAWFWDLETGLELLPARKRLEAAAHLIAHTTASSPAFRTLLGALHGSLEHNLPMSTGLVFRQELLARLTAMGSLLERALPFLRAGQGLRLLLQVQALIIGWQAMAEPAAEARLILERADLEALRLDFAQELQRSLTVFLIGLREENRRG